jgi:hypothetical protein
MQALLILLICQVTLAILAGRYGVDSRDGLDWSPWSSRCHSRSVTRRMPGAKAVGSPPVTETSATSDRARGWPWVNDRRPGAGRPGPRGR